MYGCLQALADGASNPFPPFFGRCTGRLGRWQPSTFWWWRWVTRTAPAPAMSATTSSTTSGKEHVVYCGCVSDQGLWCRPHPSWRRNVYTYHSRKRKPKTSLVSPLISFWLVINSFSEQYLKTKNCCIGFSRKVDFFFFFFGVYWQFKWTKIEETEVRDRPHRRETRAQEATDNSYYVAQIP